MSSDIDTKVVESLTELKQSGQDCSSAVLLYSDLLSVQCEVKSRIETSTLENEETARRLEEGQPMQHFPDVPIDYSVLQPLLDHVISIFEDYITIPAEEIEGLRDMASSEVLLKQIIQAWYEHEPYPEDLASTKISKEYVSAVIQAGLWPFLSAQAELLSPRIEQEKWRRKFCPVCGGKADFSFLAQETGARWLSCSRCDTEWLFQRLQCPYCDTREQGNLAYFTNNEELYRLYTCEECKGYIKSIDMRKKDSAILLPLEKMATIELDHQAQEKGYYPGWANSAWTGR